MTGPWRCSGRREWPRVRALAVVLAAGLGGCMPWVMGEGAEPVPPGQLRVDGGAALLAPPDQPYRPLPVPQVRVVTGLVEGVDGALSYTPPLTGHGRLRLGLHRGEAVAVAAAVGWGVHGIPDVAGIGEPLAVPFATGELQLSGRGPGIRWHGTLRALVPYYLGDTPAATLWLAPQAGLVLGEGRLRWAPEVGVVVPTVHPDMTQLVIGLGVRWAPGPDPGGGAGQPVP